MENSEINDRRPSGGKSLTEPIPSRTSVWFVIWMWLPAASILVLVVFVAFLFTPPKNGTDNYDEIVASYAKIQLGMTSDDVARVFKKYDLESIVEKGSSNQATYSRHKIWVRFVRYKDAERIVIFYKNSRVVGKRFFWHSDPYPEGAFPTIEPAEFKFSR